MVVSLAEICSEAGCHALDAAVAKRSRESRIGLGRLRLRRRLRRMF